MDEIKIIKKEFIDSSDLVIFDVGACNFTDSVRFRETFPQAQIFSFEPDKNNLKDYGEAAENLYQITVVPIALSNEDSEATFYPSDHLNGKTWKFSGSIFKPKTKEGTAEGFFHEGLMFHLEGYNVQVVRMDTFCKLNEINKIDYLHIDVQGAEYKVLSAMGNLRPRLILAETSEFETYETGTSVEKLDELLFSLGYSIEERYEYDTLYRYNGN